MLVEKSLLPSVRRQVGNLSRRLPTLHDPLLPLLLPFTYCTPYDPNFMGLEFVRLARTRRECGLGCLPGRVHWQP